MIPKVFSVLAVVLATAALTILAMKWFGPQLGVEVNADGLAANAVYPLAIASALLASLSRFLERRIAERTARGMLEAAE
jgi:hypothetical protein